MMHPHQNININISLAATADKAGRSVQGRKIQKSTKAVETAHKNHCDIDIKLNRKNMENIQKKSNEHRPLVEPRKSKKKSQAPVRSTLTPDVFAERRIKTEGPSTEYQLYSVFKKDKSGNKHAKSTQVPIGKATQSSKKPITRLKSKSKTGHVTSCTVPNWKKPLLQFGEHGVSQAPAPAAPAAPKKRRTQSHCNFIKNDKLVHKLLNMSMIASQLGGSQPMTSQRRSNSTSQSRLLKEYLSSMDMRIISCMQQDVPVFADKKDNAQPQIIRNILSRRHISLEELTRKVVFIQRRWRDTVKKEVLTHYQLIFKEIADKLKKQDKISQISGIEHSPSELEKKSDISSIFESEDLAAEIKRERFQLQSESVESSSIANLDNLDWAESERESNGFNQTKQKGLNIKKYRQLVDVELERKKAPKGQGNAPKGQGKQKCKEQWNSINKQITNIMNYKGNMDSQLLLDELIKQSDHNQNWIDNELSNEKERKDWPLEPESEGILSSTQQEISKDESELMNVFVPVIEREPNQFEDSVEEEEQNQYDCTKYETAVENEESREHLTPEQTSCQFKAEEIPLLIENDSVAQPVDRPIDQVWISQQLENNVVRNYLDCGLGDFGIDLSSKIMQFEHPSNLEPESQLFHPSEDEAIGDKFEPAHLVAFNLAEETILDVDKEIPEAAGESEPRFQRSMDPGTTDNVVQNIIRFLIAQFAADISVILKKSTIPSVVQKKPVPRVQGIPTNFGAITDYLTKFIAFVLKEEASVQKVVDTINKDIGPSSLQILTYLRPEAEDSLMQSGLEEQEQDQSFEEDEGLFVVPADIYDQFENELEREYKQEHDKEMGPRIKAYLSFWHRCIFQSYNECLDFERPFGIEGKPYEWTADHKIFREVKPKHLGLHLHRAEQRLTDFSSMVGGIIFDKADSTFQGGDLSEQQKHMMNQERLSRILATELLESEQSWINYNDEMAELLVQLSRMIEEKLFFQQGTELKRLQRRRRMVMEETIIEEGFAFNIEQL